MGIQLEPGRYVLFLSDDGVWCLAEGTVKFKKTKHMIGSVLGIGVILKFAVTRQSGDLPNGAENFEPMRKDIKWIGTEVPW